MSSLWRWDNIQMGQKVGVEGRKVTVGMQRSTIETWRLSSGLRSKPHRDAGTVLTTYIRTFVGCT